ncbi:MAG: 2Fe-2S iron-sulfur cluster-binding protein, partial [Woeseiaceae bacterium]|nr:2Fe-2S iron-sulfur cluster-binding protein [Woeseiaceae bacterium]
MTADQNLSLTVNGEEQCLHVSARNTLTEVLREQLGLTGTKHGCELGECGACTVLLDGKPVLSCLVLAMECAGRSVETIEGEAALPMAMLDRVAQLRRIGLQTGLDLRTISLL